MGASSSDFTTGAVPNSKRPGPTRCSPRSLIGSAIPRRARNHRGNRGPAPAPERRPTMKPLEGRAGKRYPPHFHALPARMIV